jgi:hypothetical protein
MKAEIPKIDICGTKVTRLILGSNPISGVSHYSEKLTKEMEDYFTMENAKKLMRRCEEMGVNTFQGRADRWLLHLLHEHRMEGGNLQFISQTATEMADIRANIKLAVKSGAFAVYHHGTETGNYWREGRIEEVREIMKTARDLGAAVGVGAHMPEIIDYIEEKDWDVDFYMASFYNVYKGMKGRRQSYIITGVHREDTFEEQDRARMCDTIKNASRPCLAFKILAAGRNCSDKENIREAFRFAFKNIKPTDAVVVGMFPRDSDQAAENAALVREFG